jgi:hypothetical protein
MEDEGLDPFDIRMTFLDLMKKLTSSQQSVHKVASFAFQHRTFSEDLFGCIQDELLHDVSCAHTSRQHLGKRELKVFHTGRKPDKKVELILCD